GEARLHGPGKQHGVEPRAMALAGRLNEMKAASVKGVDREGAIVEGWSFPHGHAYRSWSPATPASFSSLRAASACSSVTRTRRGSTPSDPSMMLIFWSATRKLIPASRSKLSTKEMTTASLVRRSSIMGVTLAGLAFLV